jgi:Skp family chaperone for outer membrane proteins
MNTKKAHKMARDSREQRMLKIKALQEAIKDLKLLSSSTVNAVTYQKVVDLANENYSDKLDRNISVTSLKSPTSQEFIEIKKSIEEFRTKHKSFKDEVALKPKKEITMLRQTIENLIQEVVSYHDKKMQLYKQIQLKGRTIAKLEKERNFYLEELNNARKNNEN